MKVTLKDIAEKAGVSISTVSRVINDDQERPVNKETKKLVWKYVKKLGYNRNNRSDNNLKKNTKKIGYILNDTPNIYNHPYFSVILGSIESEIKSQGYSVGFLYAENDLKKEAIRHQFLTEKVDGLIIIAEFIDEEFQEKIKQNFNNIVSIDYLQSDLKKDIICVEREKAGYTATRLLIDKGHRKIAFIGGAFVEELPGVERGYRFTGYKNAIKEAGLNLKKDWIRDGDWNLEGGYREMVKIISGDNLPTAVFAASDLMAIGAMRAIHEAGLEIPGDISVISYDDIEMAKFTNPPLTTIHVPKEEIGKLAVKLLIEQINVNNPSFPLKIMVSTELIIRESVDKPRK